MSAQVTESRHGHLRLGLAGMGEIVAPPLADVNVGDQGVFTIRPEQVRIGVHSDLAELKNHFSGLVHSLLYQGDVSVYRVRLVDGVEIEALLPNSTPGRAELFEVGDSVMVGWRHDAGMFLHA